MPEPTVQVPVSLIEALDTALREGPLNPDINRRARAVAALLSQPTTSAGTCICNTGPNTDGPDIDCPVHGLPPRIEDMAPGTTFVGRIWGESDDELWFRTAIGATSVTGVRAGETHIDPSTIRDVTPPAGA